MTEDINRRRLPSHAKLVSIEIKKTGLFKLGQNLCMIGGMIIIQSRWLEQVSRGKCTYQARARMTTSQE